MVVAFYPKERVESHNHWFLLRGGRVIWEECRVWEWGGAGLGRSGGGGRGAGRGGRGRGRARQGGGRGRGWAREGAGAGGGGQPSDRARVISSSASRGATLRGRTSRQCMMAWMRRRVDSGVDEA